ncbi:MAG: hypothetical protein FWE90_01645 [Defluviitaleaceae bacterium]|nr:hypothetical protein [Defluviitaleaceae bacterium]
MAFLSQIPLTSTDLLNAALMALAILLAVRLLGRVFRIMLARTRHIRFDPARAEEVRKRCTRLFPIEYLQFNGATFERGTILRIITDKQAAIEGEFLGANRNDIMCLVTDGSVIAQEMHCIETIQVIRKVAGRNAA